MTAISEEMKQRLEKYLGDNWEKGLNNYKRAREDAVKSFKKKYPYADISKFKFQPAILQDGRVTNTRTIYIGDGKGRLYNINGTSWQK